MKPTVLALLILASPAFGSTYPYLPNPTLTPGVVASTNTAEVCQKDYPARSRHVSPSTKNKVYRAYGVDKNQCLKGCKIDHLIPIAIGGANDPKNLWPHEYGADWNVFAKTRLEIRLRKEVCAGRLPITEAQTCIQKDWTECYSHFYKH
jgi:hypothetical protein